MKKSGKQKDSFSRQCSRCHLPKRVLNPKEKKCTCQLTTIRLSEDDPLSLSFASKRKKNPNKQAPKKRVKKTYRSASLHLEQSNCIEDGVIRINSYDKGIYQKENRKNRVSTRGRRFVNWPAWNSPPLEEKIKTRKDKEIEAATKLDEEARIKKQPNRKPVLLVKCPHCQAKVKKKNLNKHYSKNHKHSLHPSGTNHP